MAFNTSLSSAALFLSAYKYVVFMSHHDCATTAPELERSLGRSSLPVDDFGRSKRPAEPCTCGEIGCNSVVESVYVSVERIEVKFEDSRSE